jgi:predicted deacylase
MSRLRMLRAILAAGLLALALSVGSAMADPIVTPGGPWIAPDQNVSLEGLTSYDQMMKTLQQIEKSSKGAVEVFAAPYKASYTGRDIPVAKIGDGPRAIMIIAQQHGNEIIVAEAALKLIQDLSSNSKAAREIREQVTVIVMPRVNPDGFDSTLTGRPWRQNVDPTVVAGTPFAIAGVGYDINRYHPDGLFENPYDLGQPNPVPEALAVRHVFEQFQPEIFMDMHHQGTYVDADGQMINMSTLWPTNAGVAEDVRTLAKQAVATLYTTVDAYGFANVSLYPGGTTAGIARNRYGLLGSGAVLVELRGGIGQKSQGMISKAAYYSMMSVVESLASGEIYMVDPAIAENMPARGPGVSNPLTE